MKNVDSILSKERLKLIKIDMEFSTLKTRALEMEDLGNGLKIIDFDRLRTETYNLNDKIQGNLKIRTFTKIQLILVYIVYISTK